MGRKAGGNYRALQETFLVGLVCFLFLIFASSIDKKAQRNKEKVEVLYTAIGTM